MFQQNLDIHWDFLQETNTNCECFSAAGGLNQRCHGNHFFNKTQFNSKYILKENTSILFF